MRKQANTPKEEKKEGKTMEARNDRPIAVFMMGGPAAGKSRVVSDRFEGWKVLDCDAIKAEHPDYDPKNPGALHAWSGEVLTRRFYAQLGTGESFVYDGTGANAERTVAWMEDAKAAGFEIVVCYVACRLTTALKRNAARERVVPEHIVREKYSVIATSFEIVSRYADRVEVVNND